jgi:hypothetical protein
MAVFGVETWTLCDVVEKHLKSFEMWCWRRMEKISWADRVRNEVLHRVKEERNIIQGGSNITGTNCDLFTHK